ncbi:MAG: hypothetical protein ABJB76_04015 [Candidatus Nitrosocosmicus sp.]
MYAFLKEKLLTSYKKYLNNVFDFWNRSGYYIGNNRDYRITSYSLWEDFRSIFQQKKADEKKCNPLKEKIFFPLSSNIVGLNEARPEEIPSPIFDPLRIHQSEPNHFEEAKKHFKKIKVLKLFEDLKERVSRFNENLDIDNRKIVEIVSNYFKEQGYEISTDISNPLVEENTVIINNLLSALKLFWYKNKFNTIQDDLNDDKRLLINNALIAVVSKDNKEKIKKCIEYLKNNELIRQKYKSITRDCVLIMKETTEVSDIIKRRLVDEYKK